MVSLHVEGLWQGSSGDLCVSPVVYECEPESLGISVPCVTHGEMSGWQMSSGEGAGLDEANDLWCLCLPWAWRE